VLLWLSLADYNFYFWIDPDLYLILGPLLDFFSRMIGCPSFKLILPLLTERLFFSMKSTFFFFYFDFDDLIEIFEKFEYLDKLLKTRFLERDLEWFNFFISYLSSFIDSLLRSLWSLYRLVTILKPFEI
jgi:hypothetical protein